MTGTMLRDQSPDNPLTAPDSAAASRLDLVDLMAALVTASLLVVVGLGFTGFARIALALIFVTFVPGWAVLGYVDLARGVARAALAVALSLSLATVVAVAQLWLHLWQPRALLNVAGTGCLVALGWRLMHPVGPPTRFAPVTLRLRRLDVLLPAALALWFIGVRAVEPAAMNDYGLLPALPVLFFVGVGLLVGSIVTVVLSPALSPVRLALHLGALVLVLHGTMPLIFSDPIYPWVYKHVGVVGYIDLHGSVNSAVDIYHNWPGFFALGALFTRFAGVISPLSYAAWAAVYFNLLICLELAFVFRSLPVTPRVRWLGLFVFASGNWIGQDYFAPQAVAFVLSLAVFGMALAWLRADRLPALVRAARRMASRVVAKDTPSNGDGEGSSPGPPRPAGLSALFVVFVAVVVTHQLSPYIVLLGLGLLAAAGLLRPRWVVVALVGVAIGYLVAHWAYLDRTQDLFGSLGNPFSNVHDKQPDGSVVMTGRRVTALAAPALLACLWTLAALGLVRRLRAGRPTLVLALLAFSPALLALGQSYGGEAVFRIYLFSLPWIAVLGGSALEPRRARPLIWPVVKIGTVLAGAVAMFMSAFYGSAELYSVRPGEVQASQYFYDHAEPAALLTLVAPNFPARVGGRYDEFGSGGDNPADLVTSAVGVKHKMLGPEELPAIERFVQDHGGRRDSVRYLVLSTGQQVFAEVLGLLPSGALSRLDRSLAGSPDWSVFYRNPDAVIYRFAPAVAGDPVIDARGDPVALAPPTAPRPDRAVDVTGLGIGLLGLGAVGALARRRESEAGAPAPDRPVQLRLPSRRVLLAATVAIALGAASTVVLAKNDSKPATSNQASQTKEKPMKRFPSPSTTWQAKTPPPEVPDAPSTIAAAANATVIVQPGDSYWRIAERIVSSHVAPTTAAVTTYWFELVARNRSASGHLPRLYAGQTVSIGASVPEESPQPVSTPPPTNRAATPPSAPTTAVVQSGDSFWRIAERVVSARAAPSTAAAVAAYWVDLVELNHDRLAHGDDPNLIFRGQVFVLP